MQNKNQFGFLIIVVAAVFSTLAFVIWPTIFATNKQVDSQEQQVVREFYNWYISYDGNPLVEHAYRSSRYLSPEIIAFLDNFTRDEMGYDPLLCAQDIPTEIKISPEKVSGARATVDVATNFEGHAFSVELVHIDGDWLIDKVNCAP